VSQVSGETNNLLWGKKKEERSREVRTEEKNSRISIQKSCILKPIGEGEEGTKVPRNLLEKKGRLRETWEGDISRFSLLKGERLGEI